MAARKSGHLAEVGVRLRDYFSIYDLGTSLKQCLEKLQRNFIFIPGLGGTHFLPELVGPAVAAELLLTGRTISADEALKLGIISKVLYLFCYL